MEKLRLEPVREPTPSFSLSGILGTNGSKSRSRKETSENSKRSKSEQDKIEGLVKDTAQSMELLQQQVCTSPQRDPPPLVVQQPSIKTKLDKEWETFNDLINLEGKTIKTPVSNAQVTKEVVTRIVSNVSDMDHIPIAPSSELMLKIEEIPHLDIFYSPQHKAVVRR